MKRFGIVITVLALALGLMAAPALATGGSSQSAYDVAVDASKNSPKWKAFDRNDGDFDILVFALKLTRLNKVVDQAGTDFTVFAPTDGAFKAALGMEGRSEFATALKALRVFGYDGLKNVLLYHVIPGAAIDYGTVVGLITANGGSPISVDMANGDAISIAAAGPNFGQINGSVNIVAVDIFAGDGDVIHVIDSVLLP